jgi:hypothetical protein
MNSTKSAEQQHANHSLLAHRLAWGSDENMGVRPLLAAGEAQLAMAEACLVHACRSASTLSEFGTHQLEFWRLSESTGNRTYADLAEGTIRHLHKLMPDQVGGWLLSEFSNALRGWGTLALEGCDRQSFVAGAGCLSSSAFFYVAVLLLSCNSA